MKKLLVGIPALCVGIILLVVDGSVSSECRSVLVGITFTMPPNCTPSLLLFGEILPGIIGSLLTIVGFVLVVFGGMSAHKQKSPLGEEKTLNRYSTEGKREWVLRRILRILDDRLLTNMVEDADLFFIH